MEMYGYWSISSRRNAISSSRFDAHTSRSHVASTGFVFAVIELFVYLFVSAFAGEVGVVVVSVSGRAPSRGEGAERAEEKRTGSPIARIDGDLEQSLRA